MIFNKLDAFSSILKTGLKQQKDLQLINFLIMFRQPNNGSFLQFDEKTI